MMMVFEAFQALCSRPDDGLLLRLGELRSENAIGGNYAGR